MNGQRHCDQRNGLERAAAHHRAHGVRRRDAAALGVAHPQRQAQDLRQYRRPPARLRRHHAGRMDAQPVRPDGELEGRRMDPLDLARQAGAEGHPRSGGRARGAEDRRGRRRGVEPWRPPARRRALDDLGAAQGRGRDRRAEGDPDRFRHPHRPGHLPRARARRQCLHDRPRVPLRPRRGRRGRRRARDQHPARASSTPR